MTRICTFFEKHWLGRTLFVLICLAGMVVIAIVGVKP